MPSVHFFLLFVILFVASTEGFIRRHTLPCPPTHTSSLTPRVSLCPQGHSSLRLSRAGDVVRVGRFSLIGRRAFTFVFAPAVLLTSTLELYSRVGIFSPTTLQVKSENSLVRWVGGLRSPTRLKGLDGDYNGGSATVVFHGAGGPDQYTVALMERLKREGEGGDNRSFFYDWSSYSTNLFKAAFNGQAVGRHVGDEIWNSLDGKGGNIHIIGISVGAFAADAVVTRLRKLVDQGGEKGGGVNIQLTLLDPFTQRGIFGVGWGTKNFGKNAGYAQQFLNTDDPVPSTNEPCEKCAVFDVTEFGQRDTDIFGHDWPLVYFTKHAKNVGMVEEGDRKARGEVSAIK